MRQTSEVATPYAPAAKAASSAP